MLVMDVFCVLRCSSVVAMMATAFLLPAAW
jgi:hypothetical protein